MSPADPFRTRIDPIDCIDSLVKIVGSVDAEVVVLTCIDHDGYVDHAAQNEVLAKPGGDKTEIPMDLLFGYAANRGAAGLMVASRSSGPIECMHERDIRWTEDLRAFGDANGTPLFEHVLIEGENFRIMSESMGWGRA
jgi:hypothetical protein